MQVGKRMMEFDFNPRSPHGERRHVTTPLLPVARISIHAPRTGSDGNGEGNTLNARISIHAPRTGSDGVLLVSLEMNPVISIHAPRTGSDAGEIDAQGNFIAISIHAPRTGSDRPLSYRR